MAYIKQRGKYWRAEVRRLGYKPAYKTFDTRGQAERWARGLESEIDQGRYVDRSLAERTTLRAALERYKESVIPLKSHPGQEIRRVNRWLTHELAHRTLANLKGADFARYRDARRKAGKAENTIRLEMQLISHVFETARKEWGMEQLANPLSDVRKPSGSASRDRRLKLGEFDLLLSALAASQNRYAVGAFVLAIETSLRRAIVKCCVCG